MGALLGCGGRRDTLSPHSGTTPVPQGSAVTQAGQRLGPHGPVPVPVPPQPLPSPQRRRLAGTRSSHARHGRGSIRAQPPVRILQSAVRGFESRPRCQRRFSYNFMVLFTPHG